MHKILVIVAHPDDEVLGCGATIAKYTNDGNIAQVVFLADGHGSRDAVTEDREFSAIEASNILGCNAPIFLKFPDNKLDSIPLLEIVKQIEVVVNNFQPDIIFSHYFGDLNIDHRITHRAVMTACRPQPGFCVREIYSFEVLSATHWQSISMGNAFNPNYFVDISNFLDRKARALQSYKKEIRGFPHSRSYETINYLEKLRGSLVGISSAEAFQIERIIK